MFVLLVFLCFSGETRERDIERERETFSLYLYLSFLSHLSLLFSCIPFSSRLFSLSLCLYLCLCLSLSLSFFLSFSLSPSIFSLSVKRTQCHSEATPTKGKSQHDQHLFDQHQHLFRLQWRGLESCWFPLFRCLLLC